jgi:hypothetical protein
VRSGTRPPHFKDHLIMGCLIPDLFHASLGKFCLPVTRVVHPASMMASAREAVASGPKRVGVCAEGDARWSWCSLWRLC